MRIILASKSESRKKVLDDLHLKYDCIPSNINEREIEAKANDPEELVKKLAEKKAEAVASGEKDSIIIGADSVIVFNNKIIGKPKSIEEAKEMLRELSGNIHQFITGMCIINTSTKRKWIEFSSCEVVFKEIDDSIIEDYARKYPVLNWAGAYHAEFGNIVENPGYESRALPRDKLISILKENGIDL